MNITLEAIPVAVYKPRKLIIEVKSPRDELLIRHLIQKVSDRIRLGLTNEEGEFLDSLMTTLTSGVK